MLATMLASQALANIVASIFYNVQVACMLHKKLIIKFRVLSRDLGLGAGGKLIPSVSAWNKNVCGETATTSLSGV